MNDQRPDPDALLTRVQEEEAQQTRGKLKFFWRHGRGGQNIRHAGNCSRATSRGHGCGGGLGRYPRSGRDRALLEGLEVLPRRPVEYRGTTLNEFDLDAALARHPTLILVDELAHTNAPGARHAKRWQDVEELLAAGAHVYTTLNVQHVESLNDVVAQITGVIVRETVPDSILERADEIELIDLPPDDLLQRRRRARSMCPSRPDGRSSTSSAKAI